MWLPFQDSISSAGVVVIVDVGCVLYFVLVGLLLWVCVALDPPQWDSTVGSLH